MENNKFNGWTNYATWYVNLHLFDGFDPRQELNYVGDDNYWKSNLPEVLRWHAEEAIIYTHEKVENTLLEDVARHFLSDVDWRQIAQHLLDAYAEA